MRNLLLALLVCGNASIKAEAQADTETQSDDEASNQEGELHTILVTLERSPTDKAIQAASVSHLTEVEMERVGAQHPAELMNRLPSVLVQQGSGQEHLTALRSPVLTGGAGSGSFLYLQDGVPLRSAGFANVNGLFDAQTALARQIEVVRGPGDVTYGSNAIHGIFNVLSANPLTALGGSANLSLAEFDRYDFSWQDAKSDTTSGILAGIQVFHDGGYRDDSGVDQVKGQFAYGYSTAKYDMRLRLSLHHLEQETAGFVVGDNAYEDDGLRRSNPNPEAFRDLEHALISAEFDIHDVAGWRATITPYARWTEMDFLMHFLPSKALEENDHSSIGVLSQFRQDLNDELELLLGLDWEYTEGDLTETQALPDIFSFTQGLHYDYQVSANELAPFARLRWKPNNSWQLQAGVRINHTRYDYNNQTQANIVGRFLRPADRDDSFTTATSKLAASYQATKHDFWFVSLARGARPPQSTDLYRLQRNQTVGDLDAETLDSLEVGWRRTKNTYQLELTAYNMRKRNFFFRDADGFNVTNGKTSHSGLELTAGLKLTEALNWQTAISYGRHKYQFSRDVSRDSETITAANSNDYSGHTLANVRINWQPKPQVTLFANIRNIADKRYASRADFAFGNERYFPGEERNLAIGIKYWY